MDLLDVDQLSDMEGDDASSDSSFEHLDMEEDSLGEVARSTDGVGELAETVSLEEDSQVCVVVTGLKLRLGLDRVVQNPTSAVTTVMDMAEGNFLTLFVLLGIPQTCAAEDVSRAFRKV